MTAISTRDQREFRELERKFWDTMQLVFKEVFNADADPLDNYRASLSDASPEERLLALRDDPLDVAAALLDVEVTPAIADRYNALLFGPNTTELLVDSPRHYYDALSILEHGTNRTSGKQRRRGALVSEIAFGRLMERLGYSRSEARRGRIDAWTFNQTPVPRVGLPSAILVLAPMFSTSYGEPAYDTHFVQIFFGRIIERATSENAPVETMAMLQKRKDEFTQEFMS